MQGSQPSEVGHGGAGHRGAGGAAVPGPPFPPVRRAGPGPTPPVPSTPQAAHCPASPLVPPRPPESPSGARGLKRVGDSGGVALCPVASPSFKRLPLGAPVSRAVAGTAGSVPGAAPPARSVPRAAHFSRLRLLTWEAVVLCDLNPTHLTGRRRPVPPAPGLASCPGRLASAPLHLAFRWTSRDATLTR